MCELVHDMRTIHGLCELHLASGTLCGIISDARSTANCSFQEKLIFQKRFPDAVRVKESEIQTDSKSVARSNIATTKKTIIQNYAKIDH